MVTVQSNIKYLLIVHVCYILSYLVSKKRIPVDFESE